MVIFISEKKEHTEKTLRKKKIYDIKEVMINRRRTDTTLTKRTQDKNAKNCPLDTKQKTKDWALRLNIRCAFRCFGKVMKPVTIYKIIWFSNLSIDFESTWWKLYYTCVVRTKLYICFSLSLTNAIVCCCKCISCSSRDGREFSGDIFAVLKYMHCDFSFRDEIIYLIKVRRN